jgi:histidinol-phosphate phosphatase family protein
MTWKKQNKNYPPMQNEWIGQVDENWTLFLDRDGVINIEKEGDYIRSVDEFRFIAHALDAFPLFSLQFRRIFIVTNQKGVGKGLMTQTALDDIHRHMVEAITEHGGRVDRVYSCTSVDDSHPGRKPHPGMALDAKGEFPDIDLKRSLMIGNTMSDMQFGKAVGMRTIFIPSGKPMVAMPDPLVDAVFPDLYSVAKALQNTSRKQ